MTDPIAGPPPTAPAGQELASWGPRFLAYLIDIAPVVVAFFVLAALSGGSDVGDGSASFGVSGLPAVLYYLIAIGWFVYNWVLSQGRTGQTAGKKIMKLAMFGAGTTNPVGPGLSFARQLVHILDAIPCYLGFLWPLWDKENRTFADMIMSTRVYKV
jgi:uncharacterized RDD family membrane protein YckC